MKTICNQCQKEIEVSVRKFNFNKKKGLNFYCSKECYSNMRRQKSIVKVKCANCNIEIEKVKSQLNRSKTGNYYCSKSCATTNNNRLFKRGKSHPNFIDGSSYYRKIVLENLDNPKCERCGYSKSIKALHVHHKDGNRKNNEIENLELLCANCHYIEHYENVV